MESLVNEFEDKLKVLNTTELSFKLNISQSLLPHGSIPETTIIKKSYDDEGNKIINNYKILELLGSGSYCKVKLVEDINTGEKFCFKIINELVLEKKRKVFTRDKDGNAIIFTMLDDAKNEIEILKKINCKNIARLYEIIHDKEKRKIYLVMEVAEFGALMTYDDDKEKFKLNENLLDKDESYYNEKTIKVILFGLAKALDYLHNNNIVHRDIKPDNILINKEYIPKLSDFSISSEIIDEDVFTKTEGNNFFYSPELCLGKKEFAAKPVDIWAYGICGYIMVYNTLPIMPKNKHNMIELFDLIRSGKVEYPKTKQKISDDLINILKGCLEKDPKKRLTANELVKHPYFIGTEETQKKLSETSLILSNKSSVKKNSIKDEEAKSIPKGYFHTEIVSISI
jgi:calcium/calmodulin-dependent protein kinase kinase 2